MPSVFRTIDLVWFAGIISSAVTAVVSSRPELVAIVVAISTVWIVLVLLRLLYAVYEVRATLANLPEEVGNSAASKLIASMTPPELKP
jgi:CHASE2 domain-containing sensor protein